MGGRWTYWRRARADDLDIGADGDWRLIDECDWMYRAHLPLRPWRQPDEDWDHDHCELCGATFSEKPEVGLTEGHVWVVPGAEDPRSPADRTRSEDGRTKVQRPEVEESARVCAQCFCDFVSRFGWFE
jgi:hypothetical protein